MRHQAVTSQEIDTMYEQRGEVDCDAASCFNSSYGNNYHDNTMSWKEMGKFNAIMGQERREYLDRQQQLLNEELEKL